MCYVNLYLILVEKAIDQDKSLSHSDQLALLCEEEIKRLEEMNTSIHYYALPEINVATNAAYAQLREEHEKVSILLYILHYLVQYISGNGNLEQERQLNLFFLI